ncbi:type I restriction endonuclease subunit R [Clostridium saccharobutylicum]|uniref:Type I restriction enzyme endonuclease subunit n=1 Tax=Clostridium saccharobutylicum DSM 13864 TaxID=1345695 RepID=U5MWB7_CLOSA|nr:type I restriction endonuclease subunit R [Clostridium saccharobutylicum]AGX43901.1 putative type-1 restriction enzyme MjaXP R protein [Clostridium saccharobutylicum DSM 13864]AQR91198.1 type I restriction enzyme R [Clostridium saccharobutylicum]AQS01102.1 type I restriction enzyme R protein [Clostridium saccharobutylicum]AQS15085.1 type I restriction enzyme R protein [Clostridium saccharobutylicum]MBA2905211.1 type I restriction enzyme R subunit [Clostridium saccharobutylicum]
MYNLGNEETLVELPAIEYIKDILKYDFIHGKDLIPEKGERDSLNETILVKRLEKALKRLNPWMDEGNLNKAIRYLSRPENLGTSLLEINEKLYESIVDLKYTVDQDIYGNGQKKPQTVHFIDWDNVDNNDFLVTRQFEVKTQLGKSIYPDIVLFVNGIPVVVLECKSPFLEKAKNENIGKKEAFEQLRRYMNERDNSVIEGNPRLFYTNFFTGILNKYHAYVGTISSKYNHYLEWKDPYPVSRDKVKDVEDNGQNIFIQGLLEKNNLLDIMRNFLLFEADNGVTIKKICRYQQFRAVNKAIKRLQEGKDSLSRGGVVWHTQGSGKSLTMVMLARKIKRTNELADATIVVVTDRIDLDKQIYGTFLRTLSKITTPERADKITLMKELLGKAQPKIIMTTIQKFESEIEEKEAIENGVKVKKKFVKPYEVLTTKSNVIVLSDEAHRSQYKDTALNMRTALPNATFIGFTGTPIDKEDKSTSRTFGGYIDKYGIKEAVDDGATVKIVYEGRRPELHIKGESLDELFNQAFEDKSDEEKEAIKQKYANKRTIIEADDRINDIAIDMLKHYRDNIMPNGFKAQIVCVSREACVKYYKALNDNMKEIIGEELECKVIFSGDLNDPTHLKEHFTTKAEQEAIINRFKQPIDKDKLCFIIVKDMLLTGFDAPIEQVMYLDRPLKEHNLLQAIARVNRTCTMDITRKVDTDKVKKDTIAKQCGYVVDYYGVSDYLEEALAIFDKEDLGQPMQPMGDLYKEMLSYREDVINLFKGKDKANLDELIKVLEPQDRRAEFEIGYKRFSGAVEALLPSHVGTDILNDLKWLGYIRAGAKAKYSPQEELDISDCGEKVREIIEEHLKSLGIIQWIEPITLFEDDFKTKINTLKSDEAQASAMEHAVKHAISVKMDENPVFYTSLLEKLQKILDETISDWIERKKKLEEFIEREVEKGTKSQSESLGLDEKEYAFFEVVKKYILDEEVQEGSVKEESESYISNDIIELSKNIAIDVRRVVEDNYVVDWTNNQTKTSDIERAIFMILNKKYFKQIPLKSRKSMTQPLLNLAKTHFAVIMAQ